MTLKSDRAINIITVTGSVFLAVCYILYLLGGTAISDNGGLFVSICALAVAVLPLVFYPLLKKIRFFKYLKMVYCVGLVLYMAIFLAFCIIILSAYDSDFQISQDEDVVIVCGCYTDGYSPSPKLRSRIDMAYRLLSDNPAALCIVSGGMGENETVSEAESMYKNLVDMGISPNRIIKEENSRDTSENIIYSMEKMEEYNIPLDKKVVFVSSDFHAVRVEMIAKQHGLDARAAGAESPDSFLLCSSLVREFMSYIRYFLFG